MYSPSDHSSIVPAHILDHGMGRCSTNRGEFGLLGPRLEELLRTISSTWQVCIAKEPPSPIVGSIDRMKHDTAAMRTATMRDFDDVSNVDAEIESLARETCVPRALVERLYSSERAKLERTARIKTYVPVLTHRHVKALLKEQHRTQ